MDRRDAPQAQAHQAAWAKHLKTEIKTSNSVGMNLVLLPPGEFQMGGTEEEINEAAKAAIAVLESIDGRENAGPGAVFY